MQLEVGISGDDSRMTSPEARPRGSELLRQRSRMLDVEPRLLLSPHMRPKSLEITPFSK